MHLRQFLVGAGAFAGALLFSATAHAQLSYFITLENLTSGQPFSPYVFATHDASEVVWEPGAFASNGVRQIAEEGDNAPLFADLSTQVGGSVGTLIRASSPIRPGRTDAFLLTTDLAHPLLSSAWMLGATNDGFAGTHGLDLSAIAGTQVFDLIAYDAGTEVNNESTAFLPALGGILNDPEGGVIAPHQGIQGIGDLGPQFAFTNPVARLSIQAVPEPGVVALLLTGGLSCGLSLRRRYARL